MLFDKKEINSKALFLDDEYSFTFFVLTLHYRSFQSYFDHKEILFYFSVIKLLSNTSIVSKLFLLTDDITVCNEKYVETLHC